MGDTLYVMGFKLLLLLLVALISPYRTEAAVCPKVTLYLQLGSQHSQVVPLKKYLIDEGLLSGVKNTTYFGTTTQVALKNWQRARGIEPTGATGPKTRAALAGCGVTPAHVTPSAPTTSSSSMTYSIGTRGAHILALQRTLNDAGLLSADSLTGYFGQLTQNAQRAYNERAAIKLTSTPTPNTTTNGTGTTSTSTVAQTNRGSASGSSSGSPASSPSQSTGGASTSPQITTTSTNTSGTLPSTGTSAPISNNNEASIRGVPAPQLDMGGVGGAYVLRDWPEPDSTVSVPWNQIARNFDDIVFSEIKNSQGDKNFFWTKLQGYNYPATSPGFGLTPYFGISPDKQNALTMNTESIVSMYALIGGTYINIDYSNKRIPGNTAPVNLVREVKKWFNSTTGAEAFLNAAATTGEGSYWYAQFPGILGCTLASMYANRSENGALSGEPTLTSLCLRTIDTWHGAAQFTKGSRTLPEFRYSGQTLVDGALSNGKSAQRFTPTATCGTDATPKTFFPSGYSLAGLSPSPVCTYNGGPQTQVEADGAAGSAYLGLMGYVMTGNAKYKELLEWGLTFLDGTSFNPNYEILLPYGALAAARSNAEYGTQHDLHKYMNWIFSESHVRYFWTMLSGEWGGYPMYGLAGTPKQSIVFSSQRAGVAKEYAGAAAPNSMWYPLVIAPIARYNTQFAEAIGKYLSHVRVNARLFYPAYAPHADPQTEKYIAQTGDPRMKLAIPYEALMTSWPGLSDTEPYAYGESIGWGFNTNLATYAGAAAGGFAAMFQPTNVPGIYQTDLIATDIPRPNAYPTYLFYNPFKNERQVTVNIAHARAADPRLGSGDVMAYDSVEKLVLGRGTGDSMSIRIAPSRARVIALVPAGDSLKTSGNRLVATSGVIVDFAFSASITPTTLPTPTITPTIPAAPQNPSPAPTGTITSPNTFSTSTLSVHGTTSASTKNVMLMLAPASYSGAKDLTSLYALQTNATNPSYGTTTTATNGQWSAVYYSIPVGTYILYAFDYTNADAPLIASASVSVVTPPGPGATITSPGTQSYTQISIAGTVTGSPTTLMLMLTPAQYAGPTDLTTLYNLQTNEQLENRTYGATTHPSGGSWSVAYPTIPKGAYKLYVFDYTTATAPLLVTGVLQLTD